MAATSAMRSIPILLCGATPSMGEMVSKNIRPKLEVIHFATPNNTKQTLSILLTGSDATVSDLQRHEEVATHDYTFPIQAIVFGGAYDQATLDTLRKEFVGKAEMSKVPWLAADQAKAKQAVASNAPRGDYAKDVSARLVRLVEQLENEGRIGNQTDDGLYLF